MIILWWMAQQQRRYVVILHSCTNIETIALTSNQQFFTTLYTCMNKAEKTIRTLIASQNLINWKIVKEWRLPLITLDTPKKIRTIDGSEIKYRKIFRWVKLPICIKNHNSISSFLVCDLGDYPMVLGLRWHTKHNPLINWSTKEINSAKIIVYQNPLWEQWKMTRIRSLTFWNNMPSF